MRKKLIHAVLICLLLSVATALGVGSFTAFASQDANTMRLIPFQVNWDEPSGPPVYRPEEVKLTLYAYEGTFDLATATPVATVKPVEGRWSGVFDIQNAGITDANGNPRQFAVVADAVDKYTVTSQVDPVVTVTPMSFSTWNRITPCSLLVRQAPDGFEECVVMKKGNDYVIWTAAPLTATEQTALFNSAAVGINGFGQGDIANATFISGEGAFAAGMTVESGFISFDDHSAWSFFATGGYVPASVSVSGASITFTMTYKKPAGPQSPDEDDPSLPGEPITPDGPGGSDEPGGSDTPGQPGGPGEPGGSGEVEAPGYIEEEDVHEPMPGPPPEEDGEVEEGPSDEPVDDSVTEPAQETGTSNPMGKPVNTLARTNDSLQVFPLVGVTVLAGAGIAVAAVSGRRRKDSL